MSLRSIFTETGRGFAALVCALSLGSAPAEAQNVIEKLVAPGDLSLAHEESDATCQSCHASFDKSAQNALCLACHKETAADIRDRKGFHGKAPGLKDAQCKSCHTEHEGAAFDIAAFDRASFDHGLTDYPLAGGHAEVECAECHKAGEKFRKAPSRCIDCHTDDDPHKGELGPQCQSCHSVADWKTVKFDHSKTRFPLFGKHQDATCGACHADQVFRGLPSECIDCHRKDDAHKGAFGADCASCHGADNWTKIEFDHGARTRFSLDGKHASLACASCHTKSLKEPKLQTSCVSCHKKDDSHKGRNGPQCANCHDAFSWTAARFDHNTKTKFPLRGAHKNVRCESCHLQPVTTALPGRACIDCHREDDPHKGGEGEDCAACHNEASWTASVRFDHDLSAFPLLGGHRKAKCEDCHQDKEFAATPTACASCHREDDVHAGGLGAGCGDCHNPNGWAFWEFDHDAQTEFALTGAHKGLKCAACHRAPAGDEVNQSSQCIACHRADDKHRGRYGAACERCHTTASFSEILFP